MVCIDEMQLGFVPGKGTTNVIFIARQLQEKIIFAKKTTLLCFSCSGKSISLCSKKSLFVLRSLRVEEWVVIIIQSMYANACR